MAKQSTKGTKNTESTNDTKSAKRRKTRVNTSGKKPGGQVGNKNAFKHGFWAKHTADDRKLTLQLRKQILWLDGVVEGLALKLDATFETSRLLDEDERANLRIALDVIERLGNAMQTHAFLSGDLSEIQREIDEGLYLARQDLGLLDYLAPPETVDHAAGEGSVAEH